MSAEFDLGLVVEEIREESRRRRAASPNVAELERVYDESFQRFSSIIQVRDDADRLRASLRQAERLSAINHLIPTASRRPLGAPVKKGIRNVVAWYVGAVVSQVRDFNRANLNTLRIIATAITTLEERVKELEAQIEALHAERRGES